MPTVECIATPANSCGESPVWDPRDRALYWVDIYRPSLWRYDPAEGRLRCRPLDRLVSAIGLKRSGGFIAATETGFAALDWPAAECRTLRTHLPDSPRHRLNDGKCDRQGRFWAGTVDTGAYGPTGELFRLDGDGTTHRCDEGLVTPNGLAFSPDGSVLYLADSRRHVVYRYELDPAAGTVRNRRTFATASPPARPDGATVDAEGRYWCAHARDWHVACYHPDGQLLDRIRLPVEHPLMCTFGGKGLDILFVTSGTRFLDERGRAEQPLAGGLFAVHGLDAKGLSEPFFEDGPEFISRVHGLPNN